MKNPVFISNKKDQVIYVYRIYDNSLLQLAKLEGFSTTVLNIPKDSFISIKRCHYVVDFLIPNETLYEFELSMNHLVL